MLSRLCSSTARANFMRQQLTEKFHPAELLWTSIETLPYVFKADYEFLSYWVESYAQLCLMKLTPWFAAGVAWGQELNSLHTFSSLTHTLTHTGARTHTHIHTYTLSVFIYNYLSDSLPLSLPSYRNFLVKFMCIRNQRPGIVQPSYGFDFWCKWSDHVPIVKAAFRCNLNKRGRASELGAVDQWNKALVFTNLGTRFSFFRK